MKEKISKRIREYLESNEGNIDMHGFSLNEPANIDAIVTKIMEIVCDEVAYNRYMIALDNKFLHNR